ncbi:Lrp/AsnC family transcriptional regulator [Arthrobacter crystallopoietes]|uniref:Lrp/AsnC family transcriptional regulator n=1 Tax=Crystallibacter crystallopoietes TaxID=37928 RepID=UPI001ABEE420|nr:Lrp/AsnC family transcriptional regulator [Arthrobacter crystallopoietes]QTG81686.1 Lrp/AsnC family transcriptional regulator [Arthrobacter crystallopoietes]
MKNSHPDETDLKIINALQIEPRLPWTSLAKVIGVDSVTLSRRWDRISADGAAWITAMATGHYRSIALVEVQCHPGQVLTTAKQASLDPAIHSIDLTSGLRDMVITLSTRDDEELADYILVRLGKLPGVRAIRTYIVNSPFKLGHQWTLRALTHEEAERIPRYRPPRTAAAKIVPPQLVAPIVSALEKNARATNAELSGILGISPQRVSDSIATMRMQGVLELRVDIAQTHSNWPVVTWYFLQVPSSTLTTANKALLSMNEVQFAGVATGQYNLIVALSSRSRSDTLGQETELERRLPGARIVDRSMVIRVYKHLGHLLNSSGRATGEIISLSRP